ncbi:M61 family metallopeptidase [Longimicrobium sp.]|uniref:M61 family metallopeptidase n=1 Tax=Longimicrobium sp. TaxID=2029185 RepID=UPI002CA0BB80|nr:PDZ domain-containing protein [Longimicrobium sp.]HSU16600.1 PDZ domain-containing protein [Longimicrobium sp.]
MPITYRLAFPEPQTHHFLVDVQAEGVTAPARLVMPSWTPGSYLMREFPRNVVTFAAVDGAGNPLAFAKTDKNTWEIAAPADGVLRARYLVNADELSVRTSHLDSTHAFVSGTSVFMYLDGRQDDEVRLEVQPPQGWRVTTAMEETAPNVFRAAHYDELADSPLEIGTHAVIDFEVDGVPHRYAIWGRGNYDAQRLIADTTKIVRAEKALFGELPYRAYTIILHLIPGGSGGLEHRDSTVLVADRWSFRGPQYESFLALVAHELFHAWNGKRIRPAVLGPFDYVREAYTRELWVVEGITTYYTDLILRRAGILNPQRYLEKLAEQVTRLMAIPGRLVQPLEDASFDAWIKFYRPDANSANATISYYHKGGLVALLADLEIRRATGNERSLDDVMRALWAGHGRPDVGFPERRVEELASEVAGTDLRPLFDRWLRSAEELDLAPGLAAAGLELVPAHEVRPPPAPGQPPRPPAEPQREARIGFQFKYEGGKTVVGNVLAGTPAWRAGVAAGDEVVALDGLRVDAMSLGMRLQEKAPGSTVQLTVFRRDELTTLPLSVEFGPPQRLAPKSVENPTPEQRALLEHWLRQDPPAPSPATTVASPG